MGSRSPGGRLLVLLPLRLRPGGLSGISGRWPCGGVTSTAIPSIWPWRCFPGGPVTGRGSDATVSAAAFLQADTKEDLTRGGQNTERSDQGLVGACPFPEANDSPFDLKVAALEVPRAIHTHIRGCAQVLVRLPARTRNPGTVWDLGPTRGSIRTRHRGALLQSVDGMPACTELITGNRQRKASVLPLTMDLANSSPGLGWDGGTASGLSRGPADLSPRPRPLLHHLVPTSAASPWSGSPGGWPTSRRTSSWSSCPQDPTVRKSFEPEREHLPYDEGLSAFDSEKYFDFLKEETPLITDGGSILQEKMKLSENG